MLRGVIRSLVPLRLRNHLRILLGRHPRSLRSRYPDLALIGLKRGSVVVDVGAHVGEFSECVLAWQPWARIHAIEPRPEAFSVLRDRLKPYEAGVNCGNFALGTQNDVREFHICEFAEASSFLENGRVLEGGVYGLDFSRRKTILVPIRTLASYLGEMGVAKVHLLKLDVQGFELEVLKGAEGVMERIEWIYTEAQFEELYRGAPLFTDLFDFLQTRGFDLVRMTAFRADDEGHLMECDMVFRRH